ncbi:MAG: HAMP domain-containing sensor histidine kinase, partial [Anaerolineae bacterium]|nr:HAMP domain-containing sensor histidine kinase [Anaerolineae bacterium]
GNLRAILDDIYALDKSEIARLYDQTRHLTRLVNDLREIAQAEANQLKLDLGPVDLAKLVKDVGINFSPIAEAEGINLELPIPDKVPSIQGDAARLTQCLHNLIDNALRHTPRAGTIQIKLQAGKKFVKISVSNDGDGISAEHLPHVFDRFYRYVKAGDRNFSGSGLGLAIVKSMVELHGGDVRVESQGSGKGTVFVIRLPIS